MRFITEEDNAPMLSVVNLIDLFFGDYRCADDHDGTKSFKPFSAG